jgi:NAD(P)-dependent dehydrogenase (short-subunit alcohol dehydrogenase family)
MMSDFAGKTVLVTGAAGGIGQSLVRSFAQKGASVALLDKVDEVRALAKSLEDEGHRTAAAVADIASREQVASAFATLRDALGPVDILVNNAGFSSASNLETTDGKAWCDDVNGNLNGAYHCTSQALADMKSAGGGCIVFIGSVNGFTSLGDPAYSAAKAGLISYTKAVAMEYGRFGIRSNMVSPGTVRTPIWNHRIEREPEIFEKLVKWYPLRRVADPQDIANAVVFLASDAAAAISGAILPVDCGLSAGNIVMSREITQLEF